MVSQVVGVQGVVSSAYWCPRVPNGVSGAYWCLRMPNGVCECLLVSEGAYRCLKCQKYLRCLMVSQVPTGV